MPTVMKNAMKMSLDGMLQGSKQEVIDSLLVDIIEATLAGKMDGDQLFMRGQLKKNLDKYDTLSGPSAGAAWVWIESQI